MKKSGTSAGAAGGTVRTARRAPSHAGRLRAALDAIEDAFCYYDSDDRLVTHNRAMLDIYSGIADLVKPGVRFGELLRAALDRNLIDTGGVPDDRWHAAVMATRREDGTQRTRLVMTDGRTIERRDMRTADGGTIAICSDITEARRREAALAAASVRAAEMLDDLKRTVDIMQMGVVVLDADLKAEVINRAFYDIWKVTPDDVAVGSPFRALMDINRHNGIYDVTDADWEPYVEHRLAEIRAGTVAPREFLRADGRTLIYSVTALSGGKRLVSYYDITHIKDRENQLAQAVERTRLAGAVLDGIADPIFVKDASLRFVFANRAFSRLFGVEPEAMIGKPASAYVTPAEAARFEVSERQVLRSGEPYEIEEDFDFDGIGRARIVRKNRVRIEGGGDYLAGFLFDVTEMRRRETEAEEARARLEAVLESLPAGVIIYDRHNRFVLANRQIKDSLPAITGAMQPGKPLRAAIEAAHDAGYFRETGEPEIDGLYDVDRQAWVDAYLARYDRPQAIHERRHPDGRWVKAFDTRNADGTYIGVRVDITEIRERESDLRETMRQNTLLGHVLDDLPVAAYVKDTDLAIRYVNKAWCALTGVSREAAFGRSDLELFGREGEGFAQRDLKVLATGQVDETEETLTRADGRATQLLARKSRLVLEDGTVHLIGSSSDVTEIKQRERELQEARRAAILADRAKSEFLANMSHEIRTPMNGVLGMAELLAKSELDPRQRTFTDIIVKSGNALLTIINDILDFSKIDAGQLVLDPSPFNLAEAIEDVATLVSTRAKEKDLELIVRVQPEMPVNYVGDVGRVRQIITNLVGNAVKFTESGHVLIEVTGEAGPAETRLRIAVSDTGIGIPGEKLPMVFDKFSQVDSSSTRRHEGTGLGLAITSRLVDLMGGTIEVESEEGAGSTFTVTLTLPIAEGTRARRHAPLDVTGARVLVVDDNPVNRTILMEQMRSWTFDACAANDAAEGLLVLRAAVARRLVVDCIVLDYQMPGMTGAEMARVIRDDPDLADTPIVMLTSVDQSLSAKNSSDLAIDAHLIKPARSSALLDAIVTTIQRRRQRSGWTPTARAPTSEPMPPAAPPPEPAPAETPAAPRQGVHRVDILVAEDNEVNQLVFTQILSESPYTFEIVGNGRRAVQSFAELGPRMILMDVSMPEMNGLEATAEIRRVEGAGRVPIVGVTAHALKGDRERCLEAGMDDYLAKPISPNALLAKIERWIAATENLRSAG